MWAYTASLSRKKKASYLEAYQVAGDARTARCNCIQNGLVADVKEMRKEKEGDDDVMMMMMMIIVQRQEIKEQGKRKGGERIYKGMMERGQPRTERWGRRRINPEKCAFTTCASRAEGGRLGE